MDPALDWRWGGPALALMPYFRASWLPKIRVEESPDPKLDGPCWLWQGARDQYGYVVWSIGPRKTRKFWGGHRWVAHHHYGPIQKDHEPDHLCYKRNCIQPWHLEVISKLLNLQRAHARKYGKAPPLSEIDLAALADGYWLKTRPVCYY